MAEHKVSPAAMDVDLRPEIVHRHHRALDVPARPAVAELRRPRGLVRSGTPPQWKVEQVALGVRPDLAQQGLLSKLAEHRATRAVRKASVAPVLARVEVEGVGAVRVSGGLEARRGAKDPLDLV